MKNTELWEINNEKAQLEENAANLVQRDVLTHV